MLDRNKTELTHAVTKTVALWLDERGFKPVETEVCVGDCWVADLAGVITPTQSELVDLKLLRRAPRWGSMVDGSSREDQRERYRAWTAERDAAMRLMTVLVEVKTSVGDFRGDTKWERPWPTDLAYIAMPEGMIPDYQWPRGWGVILLSADGTRIRKVHAPKPVEVTVKQHLDVVLSVAVARDHKTRYARLRELQKEQRLRDGEYATISRVQDAIGLVISVQAGVPVDVALRRHGIRAKLPAAVRATLAKLAPAVSDSADVGSASLSRISDSTIAHVLEMAAEMNTKVLSHD